MKLTMKQRKAIPASKFGLPKLRKYPIPDPAHAANAKARATQQLNAGTITSSQKNQIDQKANVMLGTAAKKVRRMPYGEVVGRKMK